MSRSQYKKELGQGLLNYINDKISLGDLEDRLKGGLPPDELKSGGSLAQVWHAIYQFETDVISSDPLYSKAVAARLTQIAQSLIDDDNQLEVRLDSYFNDPIGG